MDTQQRREARQACQEALRQLEQVMTLLASAKTASWLDLFGGGVLVSMLKRKRIHQLNQELESLRELLAVAQKELADVELSLQVSVSDTQWDRVFDIFLDNVLTDARVIGELDAVKEQLEIVQQHLQELVTRLEIQG